MQARNGRGTPNAGIPRAERRRKPDRPPTHPASAGILEAGDRDREARTHLAMLREPIKAIERAIRDTPDPGVHRARLSLAYAALKNTRAYWVAQLGIATAMHAAAYKRWAAS